MTDRIVEALKSLTAQAAALGRAIGILGREQAGASRAFSDQFGELKGMLARHTRKVDLQLTLVIEQGKASNEERGIMNKKIQDLQKELDELTAEVLAGRPSGDRIARNGNGDAE